MTGIDMISFIGVFKRVCISSDFIILSFFIYFVLTETCLQKVGHPITAY